MSQFRHFLTLQENKINMNGSQNFPELFDSSHSEGSQGGIVFQPHQQRILASYAADIHQNSAYEPTSLLQRLFPSQKEKLVRNKELEAISTQHEYRRKVLEIIGDGFCEDMKLRCAKQLEANRIQLDTLTKKIVVSKFMEFRADYNNRVRDIFMELSKELTALESFPDNIRAKYEEHVYQSFKTSEATLDAIWNQFISNLINSLR